MPKNARKRRDLIAYRNRKAAKRRAEMKRRNAGRKTKPKRKPVVPVHGMAPQGTHGILGDLITVNNFIRQLSRGR